MPWDALRFVLFNELVDGTEDGYDVWFPSSGVVGMIRWCVRMVVAEDNQRLFFRPCSCNRYII